MGVNRVDYGDDTLIDLTSDTVNADELAIGLTAHTADGEVVTGLAPRTWTGTHAMYDLEKDSIPVGTIVNFTDDHINPGGSGEVYDGEERVIGSWFGKPLYRRSFVIDESISFTSDTWVYISLIMNGCKVKNSHMVDGNLNNNVIISCNIRDDGTVRLMSHRTVNAAVNSILILEYTKVGD